MPEVARPGQDITWGEVNVGSCSIFEAAGVAEVSHPTPHRFVLRVEFD